MRPTLLKLAVICCSFALHGQIRINAGGPAYTDAAGLVWQADRYFSTSYVATAPIPEGVSGIYATKRYGTTFNYSIPAPDGQYTVSLYFIESTATTSGLLGRVFSVAINGAQVLKNYDLWLEAGANVPVKKTFATTAANGAGIQLAFTTLYRSASVNAIEVLPVATAPPSGGGMQCYSGTIPYGEITANVTTEEVVIMHEVLPTFRILHAFLWRWIPFAGVDSLTVSMGRTGAPGEFVPAIPLVSVEPPNVWFDRPPTPIGIGGYQILVHFEGSSALGTGANSNLTAGSLSWEVCGFTVATP